MKLLAVCLAIAMVFSVVRADTIPLSDYLTLCRKFSVSAASSNFSLTSTGDSALQLAEESLLNGITSLDFFGSGTLDILAETATLTGRLVALNYVGVPQDGFNIVLTLKFSLNANVAANGYSVGSSYLYYNITSPSYLSGFGSFSGSVYDITQQLVDAPFQLGNGANGKNLDLGASVAINIAAADGTTVAAVLNVDLNCTDSSSTSSSSSEQVASSSESSDCKVIVSASLRTSWMNNNQNITLWDVTIENAGSATILDANVEIDYLTVGCSSDADSSCTLETWSLSESDDEFHLPSWITDFGGLKTGATTVFGVIAASTDVQFNVVPQC